MRPKRTREKKIDWFFTWQRTYENMQYAGNIYIGDNTTSDDTKKYILQLIHRVIDDDPMTWATCDQHKYFACYNHDSKEILLKAFDINEDLDIIIEKIRNTVIEYRLFYKKSQHLANKWHRECYEYQYNYSEDMDNDNGVWTDEDETICEVLESDRENSASREDAYIKLIMKKVKFSELSNAARAMGLYVWYLFNYENEKYPTIASAIEDLRELELDGKNVLEALGRARHIDSSTVRKYLAQTQECIAQQKVLPFSA